MIYVRIKLNICYQLLTDIVINHRHLIINEEEVIVNE